MYERYVIWIILFDTNIIIRSSWIVYLFIELQRSLTTSRLIETIVDEKFWNGLDGVFASGGEKGRASRYRSSSGTRCDSQTCFPSITSQTFNLPILVTALVDQKNDSRYRFELLSSFDPRRIFCI